MVDAAIVINVPALSARPFEQFGELQEFLQSRYSGVGATGSRTARSRSEALAWAVRLVGEHADAWLSELREAMSKVDDLRKEGPDLS